jgi:hypothetical protein
MNMQQLFDQVAIHMVQQNAKSVDDDGDICLYRGSGRLKCAAGVLIPNELYDDNMEGQSIGQVLAHYPALQERLGLDEQQVNLLSDLQQIHDDEEPADWREHLRVAALDHGLSAAVLRA